MSIFCHPRPPFASLCPSFLCHHRSSHTSALFHPSPPPSTHCVVSPTSTCNLFPAAAPGAPLLHHCPHLCCAPAAAESRENSFSRSRSSSVSSIDRDTKEAITTLQFGESYGRKGDAVPTPCLWVGTSLGVVLLVPMSVPTEEDERMEEPVTIGLSGTSPSQTVMADYLECDLLQRHLFTIKLGLLWSYTCCCSRTLNQTPQILHQLPRCLIFSAHSFCHLLPQSSPKPTINSCLIAPFLICNDNGFCTTVISSD